MARLPPGFRFHPTDVELIMYYLKRKIMGKQLHFEAITELNIYKFSPWDLPDKCCYKSKDLEWYFFCPRERKYASGARMNRATETGYWKTTGKDRSITYDEKIVGSVKTLVFHQGHPPRGQRTDWVIHEYKFEDKGLADAGFAQDSYVLCKVFQKSGPGPKNGAQYGAPFKEADWEDDEIPAEPCTSDVLCAPPQRPDNKNYSIETSMINPGSTSGWPSSQRSLSLSFIQRMPLDEPNIEVPGEPRPSNVSPINWMPSDKLGDVGVTGESSPSNIFSALPVLPEKQSLIDTSMINSGPGPSNTRLCTNKMPLDEQDDEIIGLLAHFTEDTTLLSAGNENNQNLENFNPDMNALPDPFADGNDIFDGLGNIESWEGLGQSRSDLSANWRANYSLNPMILPEDAAYMELNDLEIPLDHSAGTIETGRLALSNLCAPYKSNIDVQEFCFGNNSLGINQDFCENQLPMLPESYTQQVNYSDMVYNYYQNNVSQGYNAATNFSVSSYKQPKENSRLAAQNMERGVQQRKFYLSIFALCGGSLILVKAEVILGIDGCTNDALSVILGDVFYSSIFALCGGSFIFVKAEVTLEIDGCTDEALSVILGGPSCVFTCQSNVVKADISIQVLEPLRFGFSLALCFSHLKKLWYNLFWEFYEFIFLKILLNQLQVIIQVVVVSSSFPS
uniref:NAC domain-containing protein 82 n=1 Tax=Nicotiana tabacum TaxID=4097 RepID=A0A1S3Z5M1_TOBAC|nr:PREDICTED: NAC domain-containing protein 82-like [Nicotiana tabacum]XP_016459507.1 PREDICTED: NAC domain-containing protein 82-like [Nicotiana tabacum]